MLYRLSDTKAKVVTAGAARRRLSAGGRSQGRDPPAPHPHPQAALRVIGEPVLVRAVDAQIADAVGSLAQHERARKRARLHPVVQLVARVDLRDPGVIFVPL